MKYLRFALMYGVLFNQLLFSCGCSLSKAYPSKNYYYVSAKRDAGERNPQAKVLRVQPLDISSAFAGKGLVSRLSDVEFESDYYAEFFSRPSEMITEQMVSWIQESRQFQEVIGEASTLSADRVIEGMIDGLYADLRDASFPKAVMSIQMRFINDQGRRPEVIATKKYSQSEPISSAASRDLVYGWNRALKSLLTQIEQDLVDLP